MPVSEIESYFLKIMFLSERKKMIELGDAFIAFPGGTGTLEKIIYQRAAGGNLFCR